MIKKNHLSIITTLLASFTFSVTTLSAQKTEEKHEHGLSHGTSIDLRDFNEKRANYIMDSLHIPASDRPGYLRYLKRQFMQKKYPQFVVTSEGDKPFQNYRPEPTTNKSPFCSNAGFELFDFSSWLPAYGTYGAPATTAGAFSSVMNASVYDASARHTILTTPALNNDPAAGPIVGYDPLAINPTTGLAEIPLVAPGGAGVSCRLGNANIGAESEQLVYPITVTPANTQFYYQFAIVLEDPLGGHSSTQQPYFQISVKDALGAPVGGVCGIYNVNSSLALTDASFISTTAGGENVIYRKWELVGIDLSALVGSTVTIEFVSADCSLTGHFGYAYLDADCGLLNLATSYCGTDPYATIVAPAGFVSYQWLGPNSLTPIPGETNDTIVINPPTVLDTFSVILESNSGCLTTLSTVLQFTSIELAGFVVNNSCLNGNTGSVTALPTGSAAGYTYLWSTGDTTQTVNGLAAGTYSVHIESSGGFCGIIDTTVTVGSNPVFATTTTQPFCDPAHLDLIGPAGSNYNWYAFGGAALGTDDTLGVTSPAAGQVYIVAYDNPTGCRDSLVITLTASTLPGTFSSSAGPLCGQYTLNYTGSGSSGFTYTTTGTGGYSNSSGLTTATSYVLSGLLPGTYTSVLNDGGCTNTVTFTISLTVTTSSNNLTPCETDTVTLTNAAVGVHNWYDPSGNLISTGASGSLTVNGILAGTYVDSVQTGSACLQITSYVVTYDFITATPSSILNFCYEDSDGILSMVVTHDPPTTTPVISWTGPGGFTGTGSPITSLATGVYNYTITSGNCILNGTIDVHGPPQPADTLMITTEVCLGNPSAILAAPAGFTNYQWYFGGTPLTGENNDTILITNTDFYLSYSVTYDIPPFGCNRRTTFIFNDKPEPVFIPNQIVNIITPNNDGKNDVFYPFIPYVPEKVSIPAYYLTPDELNTVTYSYVISLYDRWGKLMFESNDYLKPWDGKQDGKAVSEGVYFWRLVYVPKCADEGEEYKLNGTVQVSR